LKNFFNIEGPTGLLILVLAECWQSCGKSGQ